MYYILLYSLCGTISNDLLTFTMIKSVLRGAWTGPGRGKEARCRMIIFSKALLKCEKKIESRCYMTLLTMMCYIHLLSM